jgi:hypothetical protein
MLQVKTCSLHIFFLGLLFIALLALPRNARGRIGETLDECKARYGTPVSIQKDAALFLKNGLTVSVHFIAGKVDQIIYYKKDPLGSKKSVSPSEAETMILLQVNAQDTPWELGLSQHHSELWWNKGKGLSGLRTLQALTISIDDPAANKAYHEQRAVKKNLEGF